MVSIGFHASHEQVAPSRLLNLVKQAEQAGFAAAKSSDHFHPWSERQGQSGYAWAWLGAALEATTLPIGIVTAPGYRYNAAVLAQAIATIGEMYPGRSWVALGSGEAINEAITGQAWPDKAERNARLYECVQVIRALLAGELVTHRGRIDVVEARLYSRPTVPVPLFGAAMSKETAAWAAGWADGLLIGAKDAATAGPLVESFRENNAGPVHMQMAVSFAATKTEAEEQAVRQWGPASLGGDVNTDLRQPRDFDFASRFVTGADMHECLLITTSMNEIADRIEACAEAGIDAVHLHPVGEDQEGFIDAFGASDLAGKS